MLLDRARFDQVIHRIQFPRYLRPKLAHRREAVGVGDRAKLGFDMGPLLGELVGVPVQSQRLGGVGLHRREVIAEPGELLVKVGELGFDVLVQLVVVAQAEQVVADQVEDVRLDQIGGDGVPLRAFVHVARLA